MNILDQDFRVPDHVVHRAFPAETVVLNLKTGGYHGLNRVAGRMLEVLERTGRPRDAVAAVTAEFEVEDQRALADVNAFCKNLLERGLIERR